MSSNESHAYVVKPTIQCQAFLIVQRLLFSFIGIHYITGRYSKGILFIHQNDKERTVKLE